MTTGADGATSELLNALATDVRTMLQEELDQLRTQLRDTARSTRSAALLLGGAGVLGTLAVGTSAAMLASAGLEELRQARGDLPRTTGPAPRA